MNDENTSFAQRSRKKIHFGHKDMDDYLSWMLGREIYDGSDRQEYLAAARGSPTPMPKAGTVSGVPCQVDNLALPNQTLFDWLDEIFESERVAVPARV